MNSWAFYDFLDSRGLNLIRLWLDSLPDNAKAKIDARILHMQAVPTWPEQFVSSFSGYPGIFELRIVSAGSQYRPICFYGPKRREVTIVLGAVEKGKLPGRILQNAADNMAIVRADRSRIEPHVLRKS